MATRGFFYTRIPISNATFPSTASIKFPFQATRVLIATRGVKQNEIVEFSFQGTALDGELFPDDGPIGLDGLSEGRIWFRSTIPSTPTAEVRVWAWRGGGV